MSSFNKCRLTHRGYYNPLPVTASGNHLPAVGWFGTLCYFAVASKGPPVKSMFRSFFTDLKLPRLRGQTTQWYASLLTNPHVPKTETLEPGI